MAFNLSRIITENGVVGIDPRTSDMFDAIMSESTEVKTNSVLSQLNALNKSSVVQACISMRASAFSNLNVYAKDNTGKKVVNNTVLSDLKRLEKFNSYQNYRTFNNMVETKACAFGRCYVYKQKMIGIDKYEYFPIPNELVTPIFNGARKTNPIFESTPDYYEVNLYEGNVMRLENDEIFIFYDNTFKAFDGMYGKSRLIGLEEPISTLLSIGQTATQLIADGGARGIIGQGAKDVDTFISPFMNAEKDEIQKALKEYGTLRGKLKYIVTKGAASYVPLTSSISDMKLSDLTMNAELQIAKAMGIPNNFWVHETRYKSLPEARKEFYTATIIPEGTDRHQALMKMVGMPKRDWEYAPDWSHMDFFQESLSQSAKALLNVSTALKNLVETGVLSAKEAKGELEYYLNR